ncbi:MAG: PD-(D/E)XK nuclease family protein [Sphingobacteriales bacterium]|nr:PD-(D/E)XK nuclease family protein [Sphingobacteriales bacterium]
MNYFEYNDIEIPNCSFRISPSSIGKFFSYPSIWYKENMLGEKSFIATTSTVLGTIVHASAESYCDGNPITRKDIEEYVIKTAKSIPITDNPIMIDEVYKNYPDMAMTLVNEYVRYNKPTQWEEPVYAKVLDDIYVGGTYDNRTNDIIVDYKTYNGKTKPTKISFDYRIQALSYAWILKQKGINIERIRIVYISKVIDTRAISEKTGKPIGKLIPPQLTIITETITPEDWELIENTLMLIALTVKKAKEDPTLVPLLFKSMKLKGE